MVCPYSVPDYGPPSITLLPLWTSFVLLDCLFPEYTDTSLCRTIRRKTEYMIMELMKGTKLIDVWLKLGESDIVSLLRQFAQLEFQMMSIYFLAGGSFYYTHDREKVSRRAAIPLKDKRFCVGPDARLSMWYGRSQLDIEREPSTLPSFLSFFLLS